MYPAELLVGRRAKGLGRLYNPYPPWDFSGFSGQPGYGGLIDPSWFGYGHAFETPHTVEDAIRAHVEAKVGFEKAKEKYEEAKKKFEECEKKVKETEVRLQWAKGIGHYS